MSYAEVASKGPKQSPDEAAAPQPPRVSTTESASTASLVDVDVPSVRTVPSDFASQEVQTETQAQRRDREEEAARAEADLERKRKQQRGGARSRAADSWVVRAASDAGPLAAANLAAVIALSGWLGYKAWGLHERGRLGWRELGIGAGVLGVVGVLEGALASYFRKSRGKKQ